MSKEEDIETLKENSNDLFKAVSNLTKKVEEFVGKIKNVRRGKGQRK